jgi:hypothetical protein
VPYAAIIDVLRPFRHEQLLATLGTFDNRIWAREFCGAGAEGHGGAFLELRCAHIRARRLLVGDFLKIQEDDLKQQCLPFS